MLTKEEIAYIRSKAGSLFSPEDAPARVRETCCLVHERETCCLVHDKTGRAALSLAGTTIAHQAAEIERLKAASALKGKLVDENHKLKAALVQANEVAEALLLFLEPSDAIETMRKNLRELASE